MAINIDRRLDKLEEAVAPKGRTIIIWDDRRPGCVERKKAELAGSISPYDHVLTIGWER